MADTSYIFQILGDSPTTSTALSANDLAAVHGALGLTVSEVPDDLVHESTHAAAAEMRIVRDFPAAASQTGDDRLRVITACRLLTAAFIAPHVPARIAKQERIEGAVSTTNFEVDWVDLGERLRGEAYRALNAVQAYVEYVFGVGVASEDLPGPPLARANGLSRAQIAARTYTGFVVK